jgi:rhamnogalacturonan endolyase
LVLSDSRAAAGAAVFLGDNRPGKTALDMGSGYYYTTYADRNGAFVFNSVRSGNYTLQAWGNGTVNGGIGDVSTTFQLSDVVVMAKNTKELGNLSWEVYPRKDIIFQIGDLDRYSYGFRLGGNPREHALAAKCPANLSYTVGSSNPAVDWCFAQTMLGNWTIRFPVEDQELTKVNSTLAISLAGYSTGASSTISVNGRVVGKLTSGTSGLENDPSVYRSATAAGEWRYLEFVVQPGLLKKDESNTLTFQLTRNSTWHGFMWDSIMLRR